MNEFQVPYDERRGWKNRRPFEEKVWLVLREMVTPYRTIHLRLASWIIDGKEYGPFVEKRQMFVKPTPDGKSVYEARKAKGLTVDDLKFLVVNSADIIDVMEGRIKPEDVKLERVPKEPESEPGNG